MLISVNRFNGNKISPDFDHLQLGGVALWSIKKSDTYTYRLGLYLNPEFFGFFVVPLFGFDWQINSKSRLFGNMPATATFLHQINPRLGTGLYFSGLISSYNQPQIGLFYVQRGFNYLAGFLDYYLTEKLVLQFRPGILIGSKFKMYQEDDQVNWSLSAIKFGDDRTVQSEIDASGLLVQAGVIYRFKVE